MDEIDVMVDPGHGGCSGSNYCSSCTYINNSSCCGTRYCEKEVNLEVGFELQNILYNPPIPWTWYWDYELTRYSDIYVTRSRRAYRANELNAKILVSIHHNGDLDTTIQYAVVLYSSDSLRSDSAIQRDTSSLLARKLGWRIQDNFGKHQAARPVMCIVLKPFYTARIWLLPSPRLLILPIPRKPIASTMTGEIMHIVKPMPSIRELPAT